MTICVPVLDNQGLASLVSAHFGSAPGFMLVDTDSGECRALANNNLHHGHGMCQPLAALAGHRIDALVVGGIGTGALMRLQAAGIGVYRSGFETVGETLAAFKAGTLDPVTPDSACSQHGSGHQHAGSGSHGHDGHGCGHD